MANYLKYTQHILQKMSFCPKLLNKEYKKCVALLSKSESERLNKWINRQQFSRELKNGLSE